VDFAEPVLGAVAADAVLRAPVAAERGRRIAGAVAAVASSTVGDGSGTVTVHRQLVAGGTIRLLPAFMRLIQHRVVGI